MKSRADFVQFLDDALQHGTYQDGHINGLQVEGHIEISRVGVAVDAGESTILKAVALGVDFLITHHGLFWEKAVAITGPMRRIVGTLLEHGINLYAAHLPLDGHVEWGNNHTLARLLGLENVVSAIPYRGATIGCIGENPSTQSVADICTTLGKLPGALQPIYCAAFGAQPPRRICIVSGAGADALTRAESDGFDTLITGEPRQYIYHYAQERGLNVICAGHYATETVGVCELGKALAARFDVPWIFIEDPTGI